jgi:hypothetical protein
MTKCIATIVLALSCVTGCTSETRNNTTVYLPHDCYVQHVTRTTHPDQSTDNYVFVECNCADR